MELKPLEKYMQSYKEIIKLKYPHIEDHHNDAFPLLKYEGYLDYCVIQLNSDLFYYTYAVVIVDNYKFEHNSLDYREIDPTVYKQIAHVMEDFKIEELIKIIFPDINQHRIYIIETSLYSPPFDQLGKFRADKDYRKWNLENNTIVSRFNHEDISPYSHLDYEGLVRSFNIEEFKKDFKYQMDQAEECYKRNLYLPAAATLSVALETVLIALCKRENIKLNNNSILNYLGETLHNRKVIDYRLAKRIDITYSLRNSLAHSNKGEVSKADCEIILNCIRTIIDTHF